MITIAATFAMCFLDQPESPVPPPPPPPVACEGGEEREREFESHERRSIDIGTEDADISINQIFWRIPGERKWQALDMGGQVARANHWVDVVVPELMVNGEMRCEFDLKAEFTLRGKVLPTVDDSIEHRSIDVCRLKSWTFAEGEEYERLDELSFGRKP